jgi:hypothetical protein
MFGGSLATSTSAFSIFSLKSSDEKAKEYEQRLQLIGGYELYSMETIRKYFKGQEEPKPKPKQSKKRKGNREYSKRSNSDDEEDELDTDSGEEEFAKKNAEDRDSDSSVDPTPSEMTQADENWDYKSRNLTGTQKQVRILSMQSIGRRFVR